MPILVGQGESKEYPACPEGLHHAVCVDVVDLGIVETKFGKKHKLDIVWQVVPMDDDGGPMLNPDGARYQVRNRYTASLHKKSMLHQNLHSWRGKPFTEDELKEFDVEKLIGANCQIQVIHSAPREDGKVYGNLQAIVQYKGKEKLEPLDYVRVKDRVEDENGTAVDEDDDDSVPF